MSLHADATELLSGWSAPDADQERLRMAYLAHLTAHPDGVWRACRPDHLTASALVVAADASRVLLTHHRKANLWLQMGGHCEPDDATFVDAALREATEESGIDGLTLDPVPLLLSKHATPFCGGPDSHHLDVQFLAVAPPDASIVVSEESHDVAWFAPDEPGEPTDQDVRDLIAAALQRLRG